MAKVGADTPTNERCVMCGGGKRLCEAHIIPESFFRKIKGDQATLLLIPSDKDAYQGKRPRGSWDSNILCAECDNWLNDKYDRFASQVFLDHQGITFIFDIESGMWVPRFDDLDVNTMKRFGLSVLWRAHHSQLDEYKAFSLGPLEPRVRELVVDRKPFDPMEFETIIACFDVNLGIINPVHLVVDGQGFFEVNLGSWQLLVRDGFDAVHADLAETVLRPGAKNHAIPRTMEGSSHHRLLMDMVLQNHEKKVMNRR